VNEAKWGYEGEEGRVGNVGSVYICGLGGREVACWLGSRKMS
jgi:hypothetical protein